MSDSTSLNTFPANRIDALSMLYLKQLDLKKCSPEEIAREYNCAYEKIASEFQVINDGKKAAHSSRQAF